MSLGLWNLQWLNHNSQRSYPLADWASKECSLDTNIRIPDDFILAINFAVSCALTVNIDSFYIKSLTITSNGVSICLGYNGIDDIVAVTHLAKTEDDEIITAALTGLNSFDDTVGYIAINANSSIFSLTPGYYTFEYTATAIEPDCIRPMLRGVSSIRVQTSGSYSERLYGDIVLVAGNNINIEIVSKTEYGSTIRISAVNDVNYETSCGDIDNTDLRYISTINGTSPNNNGDIAITGTNCMSVTSTANSVVLKDTCAEPCCGCAELNELESQINRLVDGSATLETFLQQLIGSVTSIESQIVGIKPAEDESDSSSSS